MTSRSVIDGVSVGEYLGQLTAKDIESGIPSSSGSPNKPIEALMKAVDTSCRSLGHTTEAAKFARKCYFAMMDYFGMNSFFLSVSPCDECSFRVRLYARPDEWVSFLLPE